MNSTTTIHEVEVAAPIAIPRVQPARQAASEPTPRPSRADHWAFIAMVVSSLLFATAFATFVLRPAMTTLANTTTADSR